MKPCVLGGFLRKCLNDEFFKPEIAQKANLLATKPEDLNSVPGIHIHVGTHTHTN